jgi:hypothetical protein
MSDATTRELHAALDLVGLSGLDFFAAPMAALFGTLPGGLTLADFSGVEDDDGTLYRMVLAVKETAWLALPGFDGFGLGIVRDSAEAWPLVYGEVRSGASPSLKIEHFPLTVEVANPLLRPVAVDGQATVMEGFSFEVVGGFSVAGDGSVSATLERFSLPPFEIVGTGLVLALDDCRLVVDEDDVDAALTGLGFTSHFRGLHATSALLDWDLPLQLDGHALPGIHASFENVAIGNQGVSFDARLEWPVVVDDGEFDETQTELLGWLLDPDWRFALSLLQATVRANVPTALGASGHVRVPWLDAVFDVDLFGQLEGGGRVVVRGSLRTRAGETARLPLGAPDRRLDLHDLQIEGELDRQSDAADGSAPAAAQDTTWRFSGRTGIALALPGLSVNAATAAVEIAHGADADTVELELDEVDIDHVGRVDAARLFVELRRADDGSRSLQRLEVKATVAWQDLASRIALANLPTAFPLPPDDAEVELVLTWTDDRLQLAVEATLTEVDRLWRFVPAAQRPQVASATMTVALTVEGADFSGELGLRLRLRLPDLATLPGLAAAGLGTLVEVDTGDADRWIDAEFKAELSSEDGSATGALSATLAHPVALAFQLPGLVLPRPPLAVSVTSVAVELSDDDGQTEGAFRLAGGFALRPILPADLGGLVPAAMAVHLQRLFAVAQLHDLVGSAELSIGQGADGGYLSLQASFSDAGLEIDLFDMLAGAASQLTGGAGGGGSGGSAIDLDIEVAFALRSLSLSIGHLPGADASAAGDGLPFAFGFTCGLDFAGFSTDVEFELSSQGLSFGFVELALPIALPELPLSREDLDAMRDGAGRWDAAIWNDMELVIDGRLASDEADLADAQAALAALEQPGHMGAADEQARFELRYRTIPALRKSVFHYTGKKFLAQAVLAVYRMLGELSTPASQASYQALVELYQSAVDETIGRLAFDTLRQFVVSDAKFVLPFDDPSAIRVEGGASLRGFAPDDPLAPLQDLVFKLGISADAIFFAVEGGADPIPLPSFGRYEGNAVEFDRLVIGYGYSKNSLMVDFAGALQLSPALIEDADTSRRIGVGVRLPSDGRLQFKLDLIPIVLGEVDFLLPLVAFDIDLRSATPPSPAADEPCAPAWDGLQFVAPGVLRASFERARFSPFFGPLPAPNYLYAFDLAVGNDELGLTQVCEDYQVITPVAGTLPVPFLADSLPFFERQCASLRLAGFGVHFELARPFPHPNPLAIFEAMGFASDPALGIDPAGHLAAVMWAELRNARITLPAPVRAMFPAAAGALTRSLDLRVDVGTVAALAQQSAELAQRLLDELGATAGDIGAVVQRLLDDPPRPRVDELLALLPRELRRVELEGSFVGFDASAVFLLMSPDALRRHLEPPPAPPPPPPPAGLRWTVVAHDAFTRNPLRGWRAVNHGLKRGQKGDWTISGGALEQRNNVGDNSPGRYGAMLIRETEPLSDLRLAVAMHSTDNDGMGVVFFVQDDTSFYRFRMTAEQGYWELMRLKRGVTRTLHRSATAFVPGKTYRVRIEARSLPQAAIGLPQAPAPRLGRAAMRPAPQPVRMVRTVRTVRAADARAAARGFATHIRVWVDDALWCEVADEDAPLTAGQAGLDSWWNRGARYDDFRLERAERGAHSPIEAARAAASAGAVVALATAASGARAALAPQAPTAAWTADDLADFGDADLLNAVPAGVAAIVVAARVRVFDAQTFRFVGVMRSDGRFELSTTADVAALTLRVAGIEVGLRAQVAGRLRLEGRSAGADSWARIEASLWGDWTVLDTPAGPLARLVVGAADDPASLALGSRGDFRLRGRGSLHLFGDALAVDGELDLSERHAFVRGAIDFTPPQTVAGQPLLALTLAVRGRVGPGAAFGLAGGGTLSVLGRPFAAVAGELSPQGLSLEARLDSSDEPWVVAGYSLAQPELALRGRIGFGGPLPEVDLAGRGGFGVGALRIDGDCHLAAGADGWRLGAAGRLHWLGRDWLQGAVGLSSDGLSVQGQTSFALQLTPSQLPAGIELAGLLLTATVGGRFGVRANGRLKSCALHVEWTLAVRLPGQQAEQVLPIASQQLDIEKAAIPAQTQTVVLAELVRFDGLDLLPLGGLTLPLPTLSPTGGTPVYLHTGVEVNPPPVALPVAVVVATVGNQDPPSGADLLGSVGFASLYTYTPSVNVPAVDLPIPVLSDEPPDDDPDADPLFTLPNITTQDTALPGAIRLDDVDFGLQLVWKDGALGIKVLPDGSFHAFDSLPPVPIAPIGVVVGTLTGWAPWHGG